VEADSLPSLALLHLPRLAGAYRIRQQLDLDTAC
jgi:hypothetical protein